MSRTSVLAAAIAVVVAALLINAFIQVRAEFAKEQEREAPVKTPSRVSTVNHEATVIDKQTAEPMLKTLQGVGYRLIAAGDEGDAS